MREAHLHSLVGLPPSQLWEALDHLEQTAVVYVRHTGAGAVHGTRMVRILLAGRLLLSPGTLAPCIGPVRRPRRLRRSPCTAGRFRPAVCCDARAPAPRLRPPSGRLPARSTRPARCSPAGGRNRQTAPAGQAAPARLRVGSWHTAPPGALPAATRTSCRPLRPPARERAPASASLPLRVSSGAAVRAVTNGPAGRDRALDMAEMKAEMKRRMAEVKAQQAAKLAQVCVRARIVRAGGRAGWRMRARVRGSLPVCVCVCARAPCACDEGVRIREQRSETRARRCWAASS